MIIKFLRVLSVPAFAITFSLQPSQLLAYTETVNGITWNYFVSNGKATIYKEGSIEQPAIPSYTSGAITIPRTLGGYSVTTLGYNAFKGCSRLTAVTIPDSVTSIEGNTFNGCSGLTSVAIPDSVTSIGFHAFENCTGLTSVRITDLTVWCNISFENNANPLNFAHHLYLGDAEVKNLVIPDGVISIKAYSFEGCSGLTSMTIPDYVTSIGPYAFSGCSGLTSVTIPDSVTNIGSGVFSGCSGLTSVTIPDSVTNIGSYAFSGCSSLTSVTVPDSVTNIGSYAFSGCSGLTTVTIPDSVTSIGAAAFSGCSGLTSVTIPNSVTNIANSVFSGCSGLTSVTIPNSVTNIGWNAFSGCSGLTSVSVPNSVEIICPNAFYGCRSLFSVLIPDSVTSIGDFSFYGCSSLGSVTIPDSVTYLGQFSFERCSDLTSVTIGSGVTHIDMGLFYLCDSLSSWTVSDSVKSVDNEAFEGVNLSETKVRILNMSHWATNSINAKLPGKRRLLAADGTEITALAIPEGVTRISDKAFYNCYNLRSVEIPDSVKSIGARAFEDCKGLVSMKIGKGVESIAEGTANKSKNECHAVFARNYTLTAFEVDPANEHFKSVNGVIFTKDGKELVVFPAGCGGEYAVPNGVEKIWAGAFCGAVDLKLLIIPDSVIEIGGGVFSKCSSLKNVYLPSRFRDNKTTYFAVSSSSKCSYCTFTYGRPIDRTLTLDGQGGVVETVTINPYYCESMPAISIPKRAGYSFGGYYSAPNGGGTQYYTASGESARTWDSTSVNTLYAYWTLNEDNGELDGLFWSVEGTVLTISGNGEMADYDPNDPDSCPYAEYADDITEIVVEEGVTYIGEGAFSMLPNVASVTLPDSLEGIGAEAFLGCAEELFDSATIPGVDLVDGWAVSSDEALSGDLALAGVRGIADSAFSGCPLLTSVTIPDGARGIGVYAFRGCVGLTTVAIPNSVTSIGEDAFSGCANLRIAYIPNRYIGHEALLGIPPTCQTIRRDIYDFVYRLYSLCLNRAPDKAGLINWTKRLASGTHDGAMAAYGFLMSAEMKNRNLSNADFVEILYNAMMGRPSDANGKANWVARLAGGVSRAGAINGFAKSAEFTGICNSYGIVRGTVNAANLEKRDVNFGVTMFVARLYTKALGRGYDIGGLNNWCGRINSSPTPKAAAINAAVGFFHSAEFKNRRLSNAAYVDVLYQTFLGRAAEATGRANWIARLNAGMSRDAAMAGFYNSAEFARLMAGYGIR